MDTPNEIPKDLGIKMGSKDEAFFTTVKEQCKIAIVGNKHEIEINETILKFAKKRIAEEKAKFK